MTTVIIDYSSGNLHSAQKSFQRMAEEIGAGPIVVSSEPEAVLRADRIVLPGVGAFADCRAGIDAVPGMVDAIRSRVVAGAPFLGICVGMQLMATIGREHGHDAPGFDWIPGEVVNIQATDSQIKIPHMGWNNLEILSDHPVLDGIMTGDHAYFVHSYHLAPDDPDHVLAAVRHGRTVTAMVGRDNIVGTQFHPEKSQATGLKLIGNFLSWAP